jgi:Family of unknown function (DUF6090)
MAKIFRKVRFETISAMISKKYLFYALGEIALIVFGILIALQIDNWNNDRQLKELEIKYLKEMISNLRSDLSDIEFNINFNIDKMKSNFIVATQTRDKLPYHDSLDFHFSNLIGSTRFIPNTSSYDNFKSKGFEIIKNDSLRRSITYLYSVEYNHIMGFEFVDDHKYQYETLVPQVIENVKVNEMWKSAEPINYLDLMKNIKFQNAVLSNIFYREYMISEYKGQKRKVLEVISSIEKYVEEEGE